MLVQLQGADFLSGVSFLDSSRGYSLVVGSNHFYKEIFSVDLLLTVKEVAPMVRMTPQSLYRAIREKQFPAVKIGEQIRIPESCVAKWIEAQIEANKDGGQDDDDLR